MGHSVQACPKQYVARFDASQLPLQGVKNEMSAPTMGKEKPNLPELYPLYPPMSHRPPGLPELQDRDLAPWEVPLPPKSDSDPSSNDDGYGDTRPLSYSDTEMERKKKIRYIDRVIKKKPKPPPPEIDDKDTDPRPLSYSDSEQDRERKLNYIKKYALRKKMKMPKFPRGTFQKE